MGEWVEFKHIYYDWHDDDDDDKHLDYGETEKANNMIAPCIVILKDGRQFVIGDVNKNLGSCDCCQLFSYYDIVKFKNITL